MKRKLIAICFCIALSFSGFTQIRQSPGDTMGIWQVLDFENPSDYILLNPSLQNLWKTGHPQKQFFPEAYTPPNAMVTDTLAPYPPLNHSWFDLIVGSFNNPTYPYIMFFDFWHKIDTDTLRDGGYITVSWDYGANWNNVIQDSVYGSWWGLSPPWSPFVETPNIYGESDTLYNGEPGFSGHSNDWIHTTLAWHFIPVRSGNIPDTMMLRFHFISDEIDNQHDGWMIDQLRMFSIDVGSSTPETKIDDNWVRFLQNPIQQRTNAMFDRQWHSVELTLHDVNGRTVSMMQCANCSELLIDATELNDGLYLASFVIDRRHFISKKILVRH
ncbi:MAG: T9SS type A sorting domain-containing protein [Bacteroidetes bacterium]|nr:T9SS type A sorting domain-containing protein [Bacteroidota bacterium]